MHFNSHYRYFAYFTALFVLSAQLKGLRESEEDPVRQVMGLVKLADWMEYPQSPGLAELKSHQGEMGVRSVPKKARVQQFIEK
jgi:hypothetical protein